MHDADRNQPTTPRNAEGTPIRPLLLETLERRLLLSGDTLLGGAGPLPHLLPEGVPQVVENVELPAAVQGIQGPSDVLAATGPAQVVVPDPVTQSVLPGSAFGITVTYSTAEPVDETLTGLGLRLHYNSSLLRWDSFSSVYTGGKIAQDSSPQNDTANSDGDPSTDKYLMIAWADFTSNWPGAGLTPLDLYVANFTVLPAFADGSTAINFSASSTPVGRTLDATLATITLENLPPTVDLANTVVSLPEDTDTTSRIKVAEIVVTDDALGTNVLSLDGTDAALFEMEGLVLYLKAGTVLDYETNPTLAVIVAVEDATVGGTPDDTADLSLPIADVNETLCVERTQAIPSGFVVHFNRPIEGSVLNLYDTQAGVYGPSDFTVTGAAVGPIAGSLVLEDAATAVTFVQTGGPLAADTYTLVLRSAANAFQDTAGHLLDGDADEVDGGDYVTAVVVPATTARRISVPDFTRGPGQEVDVPATDSGIPLTISEGSGILSVDFTVEYDPSLLTVTGVSGAADLPSDWSLACNLGTPGRVPVSVYGPTPLGSGPVRLAGIEAHVPSEAPCGSAAVLGLDGVQINGGTVSGVADGGIQVVAYFGDVTGNYDYSGLDAAYAARVAVGLDSGFAAYRVKDPVLLGDVTGDGKVSGLDAGLIARKTVGLSVPQIPDLPGVLPPMVNTGPDPLLTIPDDLRAHPGETVSVPVSLLANADGDIAGFLGGSICLSYDPAVFDVTAADVHLGSLFPAAEGWVPIVLVAGGRINVVIFGTEYHTGGEGTALVIDFHVRSDAPLGTTVLHPTEDSALNEAPWC